MNIDKKFIINLQGSEFVKFEGLLDAFHRNGGKSINTEIASTNPLIIKATVDGEKGTYTGLGDADESNVNRMLAKHLVRMAETRAIARALRWYNNIGMCSADELGGENGKSKPTPDPIKEVKKKLQDMGATNAEEANKLIADNGLEGKVETLTRQQAEIILANLR